VEGGARILDINFGMESSVPIEAMEKAVLSVAYNAGVPVSLDVQTMEIMERLMKIYPGRPLVNSSTCKEDEINIKGSLLKKYGGMMILLLMGEKIPKDLTSRIRYLEEGLELLEKVDISEERILFDPIVLSFGAGNDPFDTLNGIQYLHEKGRRSVIGLSNLSFGLPNRPYYNSAFLVMALEKGLTAAIMNPMGISKELVDSSLVLNGRMDIQVDQIEEEEEMVKALLNGAIDEAMEISKGSAEREGALNALESYLKPAMDRIGTLYSNGKIFLPQMILAAQTARPCFEIIEEMLPEGDSKEKFIIATVKGDIHDIGKNIAAAIIRSSGFDVVDLGKDVSKERIVKAVIEEKPIALGLSAMMTTTAGRIKEVVEEMNKEGVQIKVIAGGASLNEKVVKELGGDLYAKDPVQALEYLRSLKNG
jgi:5-methyltetrahydrofolate--homocysteine methyltransferase